MPTITKRGRIYPPKGSRWRRPPAKMKVLDSEDEYGVARTGTLKSLWKKSSCQRSERDYVTEHGGQMKKQETQEKKEINSRDCFRGQKAFETPNRRNWPFEYWSWPKPVTGYWTPSGDLVLPARWDTRWADDGSWWSWGTLPYAHYPAHEEGY